MSTRELLAPLVRRMSPGRGPLVRASDRLEAVLLRLAVGAVLLCLPVAAAAGVHVAADGRVAAEVQSGQRTQVDAVLIDKPAPTASGGGAPVSAKVRWESSDGEVGEGYVAVSRTADAGDAVPVWLDTGGDLVRAPMDGFTAVAAGVGAFAAVQLAASAVVAGLFVLARRAVDLARARRWDEDWRRSDALWRL